MKKRLGKAHLINLFSEISRCSLYCTDLFQLNTISTSDLNYWSKAYIKIIDFHCDFQIGVYSSRKCVNWTRINMSSGKRTEWSVPISTSKFYADITKFLFHRICPNKLFFHKKTNFDDQRKEAQRQKWLEIARRKFFFSLR